ncbi:MAG: hypothetical protein A3C15_00500 [Candidatus Magasanikbacteria bacterium RIFCSPHIGHO2_02_FULL_50_9b]|uniref:EamA domain-containing protein n=1 Tax=Candidatus Magasanikbacteria bacterium RIFCSPHIGHO2_02_FULL_50_9b TaxID=1798682 RepID=A0A1F6M8P3_9BACT|nr:MAG: hypothetical protein A3C15_00500 [Candidatus Magasanikbacteria bacterium RIFCSPHIGHO2_02_FULL_50_9b]
MSITNHTDKFVIQKYFKSASSGGYTVFGILIGTIILAGIWIARPFAPVSTGVPAAAILIASGFIFSCGIYLYSVAMSREDASSVVPFFQTIPVFAYFIEYFFLDVRLSTPQLVGSGIILCAALFMSLDMSHPRMRINGTLLGLMLTSSLLIALEHILFKVGSLHPSASGDYWNSTFWQYAGTLLLGVTFFLFVKKFRGEFFSIFKSNGARILGLSAGNEIFNESGNRLAQFAILSAPVTLVQVVNGFQPAFVFVIGIALTAFFPNLISEKISRRHVVQKILVIAVMIVGAVVMQK